MTLSQPNKIKALLSMIRPANSVMVGFAVIVGVAVASHSVQQIVSLKSLFGFITGFAISSFSMVTNDIYDVEVDRINQPGKPLVAGVISMSNAWITSVFFLLLGFATAFFLGVIPFAIALIFAFIGWSYNYYAKKLGLLGNTFVAASVAIPYIFGSIALGQPGLNLAYLLALTSFLAGLGREILKGISDVQGDRIRSVKTLAATRGPIFAARSTAIFFLAAVLSSSLPLVLSELGNAALVYSILILIPDAIFIFLTYNVLKIRKVEKIRKLKKIALGGMLSGLIAYLIAGIY